MSIPAPEDQARLLEDALIAVRQQTALMRKCLDTPGKLMDALKCWSVLFLSLFLGVAANPIVPQTNRRQAPPNGAPTPMASDATH